MAESTTAGSALHRAIEVMRANRDVGYLVPTPQGEWRRSAIRPSRGQGFVVVDRHGEARLYDGSITGNYRTLYHFHGLPNE